MPDPYRTKKDGREASLVGLTSAQLIRRGWTDKQISKFNDQEFASLVVILHCVMVCLSCGVGAGVAAALGADAALGSVVFGAVSAVSFALYNLAGYLVYLRHEGEMAFKKDDKR